jgi:TRAP-type uncharacterized transport system substrate-binding protein
MSTALRLLAIALLGLLLVAGVAAAALYALRELGVIPPRTLTIAAGSPGSAYHDTALAYGEILARDGITLEIRETRGSLENAASLAADGGADIALVQGGIPLSPDVEGLAAVHVEPLWVFTRSAEAGADPGTWSGLRVSAGAVGSGTRQVADGIAALTDAMALREASTLGGNAAATALQAGEVDVSLFVAPASAPYLRDLFASPETRFLSLAHSEAIAQRLPGARLVRLPSGILDYRRPLPPTDMHLVAMVTRLVARDGLHPALVNRLVHAVLAVHGGAGAIPEDDLYPSAADLYIPANRYAAQLLEEGFSPLEQWLPYWIVAQFNRILLVLLPAIFLLLPLLRLLPALYQSLLRRRVTRHYARIHDIDNTLVAEGPRLGAQQLASLRRELDAIEQRVLNTPLPNSHRKQAYTLLHHLDYVRQRCDTLAGKVPAPA